MLSPSVRRKEVANEAVAVGGIYSVLKSKAPVTTAEYGDRYCMIGPLNRQSVSHIPPQIPTAKHTG